MKVLANVFHPTFDKSVVTRTWANHLQELGVEVRIHGGEGLDIPAEQAACEAADHLLFVHPMHWYSAPWPLKQWIDSVLTYGWAYSGPDRLKGKSWKHIISVGAGEEEYRAEGSRGHTVEEFLRPFERTARFCQADYRPPFLFYGAGYRDQDEVSASRFELEKTLFEFLSVATRL